MTGISFKALCVGVISYVLLWVVQVVIANMPLLSDNFVYFLLTFMTTHAGIVSGYVAARFASNLHLYHGLYTGVLISLGMLVFWSVIGELSNAPWSSAIQLPLSTVVMSVLGSIVAKQYHGNEPEKL